MGLNQNSSVTVAIVGVAQNRFHETPQFGNFGKMFPNLLWSLKVDLLFCNPHLGDAHFFLTVF